MQPNRLIRRTVIEFSTICLIAMLSGCGAGSPPVTSQSQVRFVNALVGVSALPGNGPDSVNISTTVTTPKNATPSQAAVNLPFGGATEYSLLTPASWSVAVTQSTTNTKIPLSPAMATLQPKMSQTLVLAGFVGETSGR